MSDTCDPSWLLNTGFGFWSSKVLLTAVELEVFTALSGKKLTGEELGSKLGLHPRDVWDFFNTLVALRFLERDGDGREARYKNTAETVLYLNKHSPAYIGGFKSYEVLHLAGPCSAAIAYKKDDNKSNRRLSAERHHDKTDPYP